MGLMGLLGGGTFVKGDGVTPGGSVPTPGVVPGGYAVVSGEGTVLVAGGHRAAVPSETGPGPVGQTIVCAPGAVGVVCPPQRAPEKSRRNRILFFIGMTFLIHACFRVDVLALSGTAALRVAIRLEHGDFCAEFVDLLFQVAHLGGVFIARTIAVCLMISAAQETAHGFARQIRHAARAGGDTNLPQSGELLFRHSDADDP